MISGARWRSILDGLAAQPRVRLFLRLALWSAAALTAFRGQLFLEDRHHLGQAAAWMIVATLLIVAATWRWRLRSDAAEDRGAGAIDLRAQMRAVAMPLAIVVTALGLGIAFRFFRLTSAPPGIWFDEAQNGIIADRILNDSHFRPVFITDYYGTNRPALPVYVFAVGIELLGRTILGLRSVSAVAGILTLVALFFLALELFNLRVAALAAFLLAVMHWHIDFSRLAMEPIWGPFFAVSAMFFFVRGVRGGRWLNFAASGLLLGLGLHFYWAFLLVPVLFALYAAHSFLVRQSARLAPLARGGVLVAGVAFAAYSPVAVYAVQHPAEYRQRASELNITKGKDFGETVRAVLRNTRKHALMFNSKGDQNGRHNLPEAPELDSLTGILFVLGIGICLARARQPSYLLLLAWLVVLLQPAVWSREIEAPQALRSILVTPAVAMLAALPLAALWEMAPALRHESAATAPDKRRRRGLLRGNTADCAMTAGIAVVILFVLAQTAYRNFDTYFNDQQENAQAWYDASAELTFAANEMKRLGSDHRFLLATSFAGWPTLEFVDADAARAAEYEEDMTRALPLNESRPTAFFLDGKRPNDARWLQLLYPDASIHEALPPGPNQTPAVIEVLVPVESIDRLRGVEASYRSADGTAIQRREPAIDFDWSNGQPVALPFLARWSGLMYVSLGDPHTFAVSGPGHVLMRLDTQTVAEGEGSATAATVLFAGYHLVEIEATIDAPGRVSLTDNGQVVPGSAYFSLTSHGQGLLASVYANEDWSGEPASQQVSSLVGFLHQSDVPGGVYSMKWDGWLDIPEAGVYELQFDAVGEAAAAIDGSEVLSLAASGQTSIDLAAGRHALEVRFRSSFASPQLYLYWKPPGQALGFIPSRYLSPP